MIITIAGDIGAGKSTVADILARELKLKRYSSGDFMRQMAKERGITLLELTEQARTDNSIDKDIDDRQIKLGKNEDNFVIDGRISFYFMPASFKVCLKVAPEIGAKRIFAGRRAESEDTSLEKTLENLKMRQSIELERYQRLYNLDPRNPEHFDIIIHTDNLPAKEAARQILEAVKSFNVALRAT